jgi:hypothetical protein
MSMIVRAKPHLNVRSGPGGQFREVDELPDGTAVEILERAPNGDPWVYVRPGNGWVSAKFLEAAPIASQPGRGGWRVANSLAQLLSQINVLAPARKKTYDGTIGDAAHRARTSDHNPNAAGVVTALDITHDPARGMDCQKLAEHLVASRDRRIKYIIFRGRIVSSKVQPWTWRPYSGKNAHTGHLHLSVDADPALYDDVSPWKV